MKKLKQIISEIKTDSAKTPDELNGIIWQLICYPPKMPLRLQQEQLINEAGKFTLKVTDAYFANKDLLFNGFKWGNGSRRVLITHGWGSKAGDFAEIILALKEIEDLEIIAFDAPGNGSSEGELSNLLLFILSVKAIIVKYGEPDILIGHSLGAMANIMAIKELMIAPSLLISIAPLIRLKENFEGSMQAVGIPREAQDAFLESFEHKFTKPATHFNLNEWYPQDRKFRHWLAYNQNDQVSTFNYMHEFLNNYPFIESQNYEGAGHDRIIKSPQVIEDIVNEIKANLN